MILTFEVENTDLEIHFDAEGRDRLIEILTSLEKSGDHYHLFKIDEAEHSDISNRQFDEGSLAMEAVTIWLLDPEK